MTTTASELQPLSEEEIWMFSARIAQDIMGVGATMSDLRRLLATIAARDATIAELEQRWHNELGSRALLAEALANSLAEVERLREIVRQCHYRLLGITPDRNTQTPEEMAASEDGFVEMVRAALEPVVKK